MQKQSAKQPAAKRWDRDFKFVDRISNNEDDDDYGWGYACNPGFSIEHGGQRLFYIEGGQLETCCGIKLLHSYEIGSVDVDLLTRAFAEKRFLKYVTALEYKYLELCMVSMTTKTAHERACIEALIRNGWKDCGRGASTHNGEQEALNAYDLKYLSEADKKRRKEEDRLSNYEVVLLSKELK